MTPYIVVTEFSYRIYEIGRASSAATAWGDVAAKLALLIYLLTNLLVSGIKNYHIEKGGE